MRAPLDSPLVVNGGFGEFRRGHFHAGLDFGTGRRVGRRVYASLDGWIERVRASGVGYGRSLYLRGSDGRLLVFGHLDAFAEPLAAYVRAKQDSSGQYEQDLWPEPGRFAFRAGDLIAWSGESGAGGPHLHFEIRLGDVAYNPLRAGLPIPDRSPPSLRSVTLEPLDGASRVAGGITPRAFTLRASADTIEALGRLRAVVGARDGVWSGVDRMMPWSVRMEWGGEAVECRFDSVSWATEMTESDYVYDTGRVRGEKGVVLWAPAGFRPRVIVTPVDRSRAAGTIEVRPGDPPRPLRLVATDASGNTVGRALVLRPARGAAPGPDGAAPRSSPPVAAPGARYASLPGGWVRATAPKRRPGLHRAAGGGTGATPAPAAAATDSSERRLIESAAGPGTTPIAPGLRPFAVTNGSAGSLGPLSWRIPDGGLFEPAVFLAETLGTVRGTAELEPVSGGVAVHPNTHPLRRAIAWSFRLPEGVAPARVHLYRDDGGGWEFVHSRLDSSLDRVEAEVRGLGRFALLRDTRPPRLGERRISRNAAAGPYSRWALEVPLYERGSGIDARATAFEIDGRRVPSEWDGEERVLRWRPERRPVKGRYRYQVVATDRAGNVTRAGGTFVLD